MQTSLAQSSKPQSGKENPTCLGQKLCNEQNTARMCTNIIGVLGRTGKLAHRENTTLRTTTPHWHRLPGRWPAQILTTATVSWSQHHCAALALTSQAAL
mmetsp:Transcript_38793/g.101422  ORF Transcript_38793/g.101422 Transcript_38793/m.101422 type:complete len:99 (+) Transcript_38793:50-346(+)